MNFIVNLQLFDGYDRGSQVNLLSTCMFLVPRGPRGPNAPNARGWWGRFLVPMAKTI